MKASELLLMQLKSSYEVLEATMSDLLPGHVHKDPGGSAHPIGPNYAHIFIGNDAIINGMLQGKPPLSETTFKGKTGLSAPYPPMEKRDEVAKWMKSVRIDMPLLREYANAVEKATEEYIAGIPDEELSRTVEVGSLGKQSVAFVLSGFVIGHMNSHCGEIAAIKGVHGAKGYPF